MKKYIQILLDEGFSISTIKNLTESQIKILAKKAYLLNEGEMEVETPEKAMDVGVRLAGQGIDVEVDNNTVTVKGEMSEDESMSVDDLMKKMGSSPVNEAFQSKAQQGFFYLMCKRKGPKSKWCKWADEFSSKTDFGDLPQYANKEEMQELEESVMNLVKKHILTTFTKKELMDMIKEETQTSPQPVIAPPETDQPRRRRNPLPNIKPRPKAEEGDDMKIPDWFSLDSILSVGNTETSPQPVIAPPETDQPRRKRNPLPSIKPRPKAKKK